MRRLLWIGPILSVFVYASGALGGDEFNPHLPPQLRGGGKSSDASFVTEKTVPVVTAGGVIALPGNEVQQCGCLHCLHGGEEECECPCDNHCSPHAIGECSDHCEGHCESGKCRLEKLSGIREFLHEEDIGSHLFGGMEYLNWWNSGRDLPALVAAGDGLPPNPTLFGGNEVADEYQAAARMTIGYWLDYCDTTAWVFRGYGADGTESELSLQSNGTPAFAIPFINDGSNVATAGSPDALILADAGLLQPGVPASVHARATSQIYGGDVFLRRQFRRGHGYRIDWLAGYQFTRIHDDVTLNTSTNRVGGGNPMFTTYDSFDAENHFNGGEIGLILELDRGPMTLRVLGKFGFGNMNQEVVIRGANSVDGVVTGGGIFAQNRSTTGGPDYNIGTYERDEFIFSPELNVQSIWHLRKNVDFTVGYGFMYWSDVAQAGSLIDTRINPDVFFDGAFLAGGGSNPSFQFADSGLWAHTVDIGLMFRY